MKKPCRVTALPTSLPDAEHGHGVILTLYTQSGYDTAIYIDRDQAVQLRDSIDHALEKGADRAAA